MYTLIIVLFSIIYLVFTAATTLSLTGLSLICHHLLIRKRLPHIHEKSLITRARTTYLWRTLTSSLVLMALFLVIRFPDTQVTAWTHILLASTTSLFLGKLLTNSRLKSKKLNTPTEVAFYQQYLGVPSE